MAITTDIRAYHAALSAGDRKICAALAKAIERAFKEVEGVECKVWHRHPVWFIDGNPIVGYSTHKTPRGGGEGAGGCIRLMFWSGQSFDEPGLSPAPPDTKFKTAAVTYTSVKEIDAADLARWLEKSIAIQWDYKNIVKRKGKLVRLK